MITDYHQFDSEGACISGCPRCAYLGIPSKPVHYHAGSNVSGYLPMSDDTGYPYETFEDAMSSLEDELTRAWDSDADAYEESSAATWLAAFVEEEYSRARDDMRNATAPAFCTYVPTNFDSEHDIPTAYWVSPCSEECSADE